MPVSKVAVGTTDLICASITSETRLRPNKTVMTRSSTGIHPYNYRVGADTHGASHCSAYRTSLINMNHDLPTTLSVLSLKILAKRISNKTLAIRPGCMRYRCTQLRHTHTAQTNYTRTRARICTTNTSQHAHVYCDLATNSIQCKVFGANPFEN